VREVAGDITSFAGPTLALTRQVSTLSSFPRFRKIGPLRYVSGICLFFLALSGACAGVRRPPPVLDRSEDNRILQEVQARLAAEPALDATQIRVEVNGGVVALHGTVRGLEAWRCALRTAELVSGVSSVVEFLVIERGPRNISCLAPRTSSLPMARVWRG
jgi:hypothetical protein